MPQVRVNVKRELRGGGKRVVPQPKSPHKVVNERVMWALVDQGLRPAEIAKKMGINTSSVTYRIKRRQKATTELVVASEARPVVQRELNAIDQLHRINEDANKLLMAAMGGIRQLEAADVSEMGVTDALDLMKAIGQGRDVALKAMGEIRVQLKLQLDLFQALYDVRAAEEFQREVLDAIREVAPDVRDRILDRLRQRRAVRQLVQPS